MAKRKTMRIEITQPLETCPKPCGHAHPGGVGVFMCGCRDCLLLFQPIDWQYLTPEFRARKDELRALQQAERDGVPS